MEVLRNVLFYPPAFIRTKAVFNLQTDSRSDLWSVLIFSNIWAEEHESPSPLIRSVPLQSLLVFYCCWQVSHRRLCEFLHQTHVNTIRQSDLLSITYHKRCLHNFRWINMKIPKCTNIIPEKVKLCEPSNPPTLLLLTPTLQLPKQQPGGTGAIRWASFACESSS